MSDYQTSEWHRTIRLLHCFKAQENHSEKINYQNTDYLALFPRRLPPVERKAGGQAGETDICLGLPTKRLPKTAHVLSKNPYSVALGLVLLAYSRDLVQTVGGGHATRCVCGPQNAGADMPNYLYQ